MAEVSLKVLPFLKPKPQAGTSAVTYRKPDEAPEPKDESHQGLREAMQEFISATASGDATKAAEAFKSAYQICSGEEVSQEFDFGSEDTE